MALARRCRHRAEPGETVALPNMTQHLSTHSPAPALPGHRVGAFFVAASPAAPRNQEN